MTTGIDAYVTALGERLRGSRALTDDVLTEVRDGLCDAADAYRTAGLDDAEAERRAVAEFGEVADLVPQFQRELALSQGRRTALKLGALMPLSVFLSAMAWTFLAPSISLGSMATPPRSYGIAMQAVDLFGYGSGLFFLVLWVLMGPGARVLPLPQWAPRAVARCAVGLIAASMLAGFALCGVGWIWAPSAILSMATLVNAVVWAICFTLAIRTTRRALLAAA